MHVTVQIKNLSTSAADAMTADVMKVAQGWPWTPAERIEYVGFVHDGVRPGWLIRVPYEDPRELLNEEVVDRLVLRARLVVALAMLDHGYDLESAIRGQVSIAEWTDPDGHELQYLDGLGRDDPFPAALR